MYWADELVLNLDKSKHHRVDDMKTPSGRAHAGSLRAIASHGLTYEAMKKAQFNVDFTYVINDMDPMDGLPVYLDQAEYSQHMGKSLFLIPAPDGKSVNFAEQYASEYINAFNSLGFNPSIFRSSELYKSGKMNDSIKMALDNVEEIRKIYLEVAKQKKPEGWYPFQVICPNCNKVGSSLVTNWDGEFVYYECKKDLVDWAVGCGQTGKISPFNGTGKLMWKVDWPMHWKVMGITVEGAGKDHLSRGGSHEIAVEIMKRVFKSEPPFAFLHEFLLIGGAKMSSSKGNATTAADFVTFIPAELGRFLFVRTPLNRAVNFDPFVSRTIPDLFDDYDKCAEAYWEQGEDDLYGRLFQASQLNDKLKDHLFLPRFRQITTLLQIPSLDLFKYFIKDKGSELNEVEKEILEERIKYGQLWLDKFAEESDKFAVQETLPKIADTLTDIQKDFLIKVSEIVDKGDFSSDDDLQQKIYDLTKVIDIKSKDAFEAVYKVLLGKTQGPKAGALIASQEKQFILDRFNLKK